MKYMNSILLFVAAFVPVFIFVIQNGLEIEIAIIEFILLWGVGLGIVFFMAQFNKSNNKDDPD